MINPNKLGGGSWPYAQSQWMLVGVSGSAPVVATGYSMTGPSSGTVGVASSNFTVTLTPSGGTSGSVTITPSSGGGGGTFTPSTVALSTGTPSATFTYTAASAGVKTISATNSGSLTNPANLSYTATAAGLIDGDPVSSWTDSSGAGNTATQSGAARPTFKTSILNGKPVVRFSSASSQFLNVPSTPEPVTDWWMFVVMAGTPATELVSLSSGTNDGTFGPLLHQSGTRYIGRYGGIYSAGSWSGTAAHVYTSSGIAASFYADGTSVATAFVGGVTAGPFDAIGKRGGIEFSTGDIAEIIIYNVAVSSTDRANIEKYLGTKYAITVAGGSAVQPDTVSGLVGWWKADSLGT